MYLITGCAGFIGFSTAIKLLKEGKKVLGVDNLNNYYDQKLKLNRLKNLKTYKKFKFYKINICDKKRIFKVFNSHNIEYVIHLAAQAGVRYSLEKPDIYFNYNISGFYNIIKFASDFKIKHFIFGSSSSVYGEQKKFPIKEEFTTDYPIQFYAATKKSNEVMAYSLSKINKLPCTGLRFFTVYGPWGRPDMAFFKFMKNILQNKPINLYNYGKHFRDFSYIDNVVDAILSSVKKSYSLKIAKNKKTKRAPFTIYNVGNGKSVSLKTCVQTLESILKIKIKFNRLPLQKGDVIKTFANVSKAKKDLNLKTSYNLKKGLTNFVNWYHQYYNIR